MRAAIVLAAGASRRFGRQDKLAANLRGRSLLDCAIANAHASGVQRVIVVTARSQRIPGVTLVLAKLARDGLSESLAAGLAALRPIEREALVFLGDMPFARAPRTLRRARADATRPHFCGRPGHPMLILASAARKALLAGDAGLGGKLKTTFVRGDAGNILDIDTTAMLARVRRHGSRALGPRCTPS